MKTCSIMIIDDNEGDRYLLKRMINKLEVETKIFEADDGKSALEFLMNYEENLKKYAEDFPPFLIFLDINMPLISGFEFLERFSELRKQNSGYMSSIFAMFSSSERDEDKKKAESYDFVKGYVIKGDISLESLQEIIEKCLSNN